MSASLFCADSKNDPFSRRYQTQPRTPPPGTPAPGFGKTFREKTPARFPFRRESGPGRGASANVPSLDQAPPKRSSSVQIFHRQRSGSPAAFCRKSKAAEAGSARCESSISRGGRPATFHRESKFTETAPLDANFPSAEKRQTEAVHRESKPTKAAPSRRNFQIDEGAITRQRSAAGQAIPQPHPARTEPAPESNPFFPA